eukprot:COSAG02_NODE_25816_length_648_cov_0.939891_1_plen_78_part_10
MHRVQYTGYRIDVHARRDDERAAARARATEYPATQDDRVMGPRVVLLALGVWRAARADDLLSSESVVGPNPWEQQHAV